MGADIEIFLSQAYLVEERFLKNPHGFVLFVGLRAAQGVGLGERSAKFLQSVFSRILPRSRG